MRLPLWTSERLQALGIYVERYGRGDRGRPTVSERSWYFCGYYWHRGTKARVSDGPFGPFPCASAAVADALAHADAHQWREETRARRRPSLRIVA